MKRGIIPLLIIALVSKVYAYGQVGSYNNFSFTNLITNIDAEFLITVVLFIAFFGALNKALTQTNLIHHNAARIVISLSLTLFGLYGLVKSQISLTDILFKVGVSQETIITVVPWIILLIAIYIMVKKGPSFLFILVGLILIISAVLSLVYERGIALALGIILLLIGLWLKKKRKGKVKGKIGLHIKTSNGNLTCWRIPSSIKLPIPLGGKDTITITNEGEENMTWKASRSTEINLSKYGGTIKSGEDDTVTIESSQVAINKKVTIYGRSLNSMKFSPPQVGILNIIPGKKAEKTNDKSGIKILEKHAKNLREEADKKKEPLHKSWAYFIKYLGDKGCGKTEKEIMQKLNVSKEDIMDAVRKYIK